MSDTLGTPCTPADPAPSDEGRAATTRPAAPASASASEPFGQLTHYAGFNWAKGRHHVAVVDPAGTVLLGRPVGDTAEGWAGLRQALAAFPKVGVAIETSCGPAVERLLEMGLTVYPLNPKADERYRDRKRPGGGKSDPLDGAPVGTGGASPTPCGPTAGRGGPCPPSTRSPWSCGSSAATRSD